MEGCGRNNIRKVQICLNFQNFNNMLYLHSETSDKRENNDLLPDQLSKFILVRLEYVEEDKPSNILQRSAGFCKMPITWSFNVVVSLTGNDEVTET
jgi:hypothetical protein